MGRPGDACGAVTGAWMVLGLKYGAIVADPAAKERTYAQTREFIARFEVRQGATACADLLGVNIGTPEGQAAARSEPLQDDLSRFGGERRGDPRGDGGLARGVPTAGAPPGDGRIRGLQLTLCPTLRPRHPPKEGPGHNSSLTPPTAPASSPRPS